MSEKTLFRIGSRSAIIGGILGLVVNVLHPRALPGAHPEAYLEEVAGYTIWVPDHLGIFFAIVLAVGGLLAISRSITAGPGTVWARLVGRPPSWGLHWRASSQRSMESP